MTGLSIVVVNWNTRDLLAACLASIQSHPPACAFEVWVVDNSSADGSAAMIRERYGDVRVIENQENVGFARANNQAICASAAKFVLLLNSDTVVNPGALTELVRFMQEHPGAGVAGAQLLNRDGSLQRSVQRFPTCISELMTVSGLFHQRTARTYEVPTQVEAVVGASMMVRRTAFEEVGLLDERYFMYTEEVDWCHRIHNAGWDVYIVPSARIVHVDGGSSGPIAADKLLWLSRGRLRFLSAIRPSWMIRLTHFGLRLIGAAKTLAWLAIGIASVGMRERASLKARANWRLATWRSLQ